MHQSRADTCMLRYNTSTVLKLYAITRHIQEPGAVIFSSDDLLLQLNQTNLEQFEKQYAVSPLKHPKLSRKLFNKEQTQIKNVTILTTKNNGSNAKPVENKVSVQQNNQNQNDKFKTSNNVIALNGLNNMKKTKGRKKILNMNNVNENLIENNVNSPSDINPEKAIYNPMIVGKQPINDQEILDEEIVKERQKELKDFILANRERFGAVYGSDREQDPEQPNNIEEYDGYDPNYRGQYSNNRDIRSKQEFGKFFTCYVLQVRL